MPFRDTQKSQPLKKRATEMEIQTKNNRSDTTAFLSYYRKFCLGKESLPASNACDMVAEKTSKEAYGALHKLLSSFVKSTNLK
jgi:hypothetical protein